MGAPFGNQVKRIVMYNFCLDRIGKRISGWANKLLSFIGKVLLIQHVLQSITTYHMMYTLAFATTIQQINWLFKDLMWGFDRETGYRKIPTSGLEETHATKG